MIIVYRIRLTEIAAIVFFARRTFQRTIEQWEKGSNHFKGGKAFFTSTSR